MYVKYIDACMCARLCEKEKRRIRDSINERKTTEK